MPICPWQSSMAVNTCKESEKISNIQKNDTSTFAKHSRVNFQSEEEQRASHNAQTCFKNASSAASPRAMTKTSLMMTSFFCRSTSQSWPRVTSRRTQLTCRHFISCFQCLSLNASDFNSITSVFTSVYEVIMFLISSHNGSECRQAGRFMSWPRRASSV